MNDVIYYCVKVEYAMEYFYRKTQFILLTCIATFLLILCFETGHLNKVLAQSVQKVAICEVQGNNCASIRRISHSSTKMV